MSVSLTKIIYDPSRLKTPNIKDSSSSSSEKTTDVKPTPPILMDEFGQTPDHFYLARKPPTFFQVKRKLDLQTSPSAEESNNRQSKPKNVADKPRYDTSLGQLTKKFLKLLSDAADGVINLNTACTLLCVPKRRLYDITNVLEGAGLVQKTSRNNIQWMGRVSSPISNAALEKEIDILEAKENKLDELIYHMKAEINSMKESEGKYHYITSRDLKNIEEFSKKTVVGVKIAPTGQLIEAFEKKLILTSKSTGIDAFLLQEDLSDVSFTDILHTRAEFKENTYNVKIAKNALVNLIKEEPYEEPCGKFGESPDFGSSYSQMCSGTTWSDGDMVIKNAFITEEDDIAPMSKHFLLQTEDQDLDDFSYADIETHVDSYAFSLDDGEGLTDLFDCNFPEI